MSIDAKSDAISKIIPKNFKVEKLSSGFIFTEGPVWNAKGGFLLFSDIPGDKIRKWIPDKGISKYREPSGKSNGLTYDKQMRLIACEHANRRVSRADPGKGIVAIASHYNGKKLNSPNDVVVKSDQSIYFSDPPYGLTKEYGVEGAQELNFQGVYRISPDGKTLTLLKDDFNKPNGLAFSPDESRLYIDDTDEKHVRAFNVKKDGTLGKGEVFAELKAEGVGAPDGLKVDVEGNVYVTGPGGIWVFNKSGKHLGTIIPPELPCANFAWGGRDWKWLYMTTNTSICRARLNVAGIKVPK